MDIPTVLRSMYHLHKRLLGDLDKHKHHHTNPGTRIHQYIRKDRFREHLIHIRGARLPRHTRPYLGVHRDRHNMWRQSSLLLHRVRQEQVVQRQRRGSVDVHPSVYGHLWQAQLLVWVSLALLGTGEEETVTTTAKMTKVVGSPLEMMAEDNMVG